MNYVSRQAIVSNIYPGVIFLTLFIYDVYVSTEGLLELVIVQMIQPLRSKNSAQTLDILRGMYPTMLSFHFIATA